MKSFNKREQGMWAGYIIDVNVDFRPELIIPYTNMMDARKSTSTDQSISIDITSLRAKLLLVRINHTNMMADG